MPQDSIPLRQNPWFIGIVGGIIASILVLPLLSLIQLAGAALASSGSALTHTFRDSIYRHAPVAPSWAYWIIIDYLFFSAFQIFVTYWSLALVGRLNPRWAIRGGTSISGVAILLGGFVYSVEAGASLGAYSWFERNSAILAEVATPAEMAHMRSEWMTVLDTKGYELLRRHMEELASDHGVKLIDSASPDGF